MQQGLKECLERDLHSIQKKERDLHLPPSKGTSGARTQDQRPVFLPLNKIIGVKI